MYISHNKNASIPLSGTFKQTKNYYSYFFLFCRLPLCITFSLNTVHPLIKVRNLSGVKKKNLLSHFTSQSDLNLQTNLKRRLRGFVSVQVVALMGEGKTSLLNLSDNISTPLSH